MPAGIIGAVSSTPPHPPLDPVSSLQRYLFTYDNYRAAGRPADRRRGRDRCAAGRGSVAEGGEAGRGRGVALLVQAGGAL